MSPDPSRSLDGIATITRFPQLSSWLFKLLKFYKMPRYISNKIYFMFKLDKVSVTCTFEGNYSMQFVCK